MRFAALSQARVACLGIDEPDRTARHSGQIGPASSAGLDQRRCTSGASPSAQQMSSPSGPWTAFSLARSTSSRVVNMADLDARAETRSLSGSASKAAASCFAGCGVKRSPLVEHALHHRAVVKVLSKRR